MSRLGIAPLLLAFLLMPSAVMSGWDIAGLLDKKGPQAKEVVTGPTISRVSKLSHLPVSLRQYEFLVDHPRLSLALARAYDPALDLYKVEVRPSGMIHVDDPAGLAGDMELIDSTHGRRIYFITGHFDVLKMRFFGRVVMVLSFSEHLKASGASVDAATASYIKVDSAFVGFVAKIMAFLFPKKVDDRIGRFSNAVKTVAVSLHDDPAGAYGRLAASGEFSARELDEFAALFVRRM